MNRIVDPGAILEKASTNLFRPVAAGYHNPLACKMEKSDSYLGNGFKYVRDKQ